MRHFIINTCFILSTFGSAVTLNNAQAAVTKPTGWFIRLIAEAPADKLKDPGNVLGLLSDSINTYDSHDLEELPPFGSTYLTLVFPHPEWGAKAGDYTSDFQKPDKKTHQWSFEVRTDNIARQVTLRWEGDNARLLHSKLRDLKTNKVYNAGITKSLTITMGATKRLFVWQVLP